MLNLYRYKSISKYFDLYIGGGFGYTRISPEDGIIMVKNKQAIYSAKPSNNFSYNLASGVSLKVNDNAELNFGYRFLDYGKVKGFDSVSVVGDNIPKYNHRPFPHVKSRSLRGHNFSLGIIYKLPPNSAYKKP
jgi:opacity protein-like surface antigen